MPRINPIVDTEPGPTSPRSIARFGSQGPYSLTPGHAAPKQGIVHPPCALLSPPGSVIEAPKPTARATPSSFLAPAASPPKEGRTAIPAEHPRDIKSGLVRAFRGLFTRERSVVIRHHPPVTKSVTPVMH